MPRLFLTLALLVLAGCDSGTPDTPPDSGTPVPTGPYAGVFSGDAGAGRTASPWTEGHFTSTGFNVAGLLPIVGSAANYEVVISTSATVPGTYAVGQQGTRIETRRYAGPGDNHTRVVASAGQVVVTEVTAGGGARGRFSLTATDGATYTIADGVFSVAEGYTQN